ncbi:MAG: hypothetical protein ACRDGD_07325 [Candidatus Limnocylindria bacterium]
MIQQPSPAERLDRAIGGILDGEPSSVAAAGVDQPMRPLVDLASALRAALAPPPVGSRFEARLQSRLAAGSEWRDPVAWAMRHPGRLLVTGAVGSAAVGVTVTALAVWRSSRRGASHRLLHR